MSLASPVRADVVLVGGGLANGLIALRLKSMRPDLKMILVEQEAHLGGRHTWCHFATDVDPGISSWLRPLIVHRWAGYDVRFPSHRRSLTTPYMAITSERLHQVVSELLGSDVWLGVGVSDVTEHRVSLADGRVLEAPAVIDGRGPRPSRHLELGWQKFLGQEVVTAAPHGLDRPIVMDATVDQLDGYRFLYVLPLAADRLLIEDTRYSDHGDLDREALRRTLADYAAAQGWQITSIVREEEGVLPIALGGDLDAYWREAKPGLSKVGLRAALFHPTTGYSLPDAARLAEAVAGLAVIDSAQVRALAEGQSKACWKARGFYRLLNRMLFRACAPDQRYRVLERFYKLPQGLIQRFYAGRAAWADKARILIGKPPVPIRAALAVMYEARVRGAAAPEGTST
jgi:lycopene beta-cyclase